MIDVSRDYSSLRIAAREYFDEGWAFQKTQRTLLHSRVADRAGFIARALPQRSMAEGYYTWIEYLAWLAGMHEIARFRDLTACEAMGLQIFNAARNEFLRRHPHCAKCGAMNDKFALACCECGCKFGE